MKVSILSIGLPFFDTIFWRTKMKRCILILCICLLTIGCNKNTEKNKSTASNNIPVKDDRIFPIEEKKNFGTICITNIIENNVNVRNLSSLDGKIIHKAQKDDIVWILGFSGEEETINGLKGNWLHIIFENNKDIDGWVFSKYLNTNDKKYAPIKFVELIPQTNTTISLVKLSYTLDNEEIFIKQDYSKWNNYYVIIWGQYEHGFHYTNRPGVYLLDKDTLELKHITYLGSFEPWPHAYTSFTDDFKYLLQDSGTSQGIRGITAWRLSDQDKVFDGSYLRWEVNGHTINIAYSYKYSFDEEILAYGEKYQEENKIPQDIEDRKKEYGLGIELVIICTYNLDTGERKIIDGIYINTQ